MTASPPDVWRNFKRSLTVSMTASPPDVRQGYALPEGF